VTLGALAKSVIDAEIQKNTAQIRYCYQRALSGDPTLAGEVVVKFVITKDGTVSSAATKRSTLAAPAVEACINERFMHFRFPEPTGGGIVIVSYPFVFEPAVGSREVVLTRPHPDAQELASGVAPALDKATTCYASGSPPSARFVVREDGAVADLRLVGIPEPTDAELACVREAFTAAHFPPPGERVPVYYPLPPGRGSGATGPAGALAPPPAAAVPDDVLVGDGLDHDTVVRRVEKRSDRIRACYTDELFHRPSMAGQVVARLTVGPDGKPHDVDVTPTTLGDAGGVVCACIRDQLEQLRFPAPTTGADVAVTYPFELQREP
jgi:hypothetical protein